LVKEIDVEFNNFLALLTKAIGSKLTEKFPANEVQKICVGVTREHFNNVLDGTITTLNAIKNRAGAVDHYDDAVSVLLIQLIGPLNRIDLAGNVERNELFHAYLSILSKVLQQEKVRTRFTVIMDQAMKAA
jgi:hypothetical protein